MERRRILLSSSLAFDLIYLHFFGLPNSQRSPPSPPFDVLVCTSDFFRPMFSLVLVLVHVLYFIMVFHFIAFADSSSPLGDISALFLFVYSPFSSLPKICARPSRVVDHISLLPICLCHTFRPRYPRPVHVDSSIHPLSMTRCVAG